MNLMFYFPESSLHKTSDRQTDQARRSFLSVRVRIPLRKPRQQRSIQSSYNRPSKAKHISIGVPIEKKKKKEQGEARRENDARPVGARRPRYAASGDTGEGDGGREPNERSSGAEDDDGEGDEGEARKLVNARE
jgi:hypothetical protein